LTDESDSSNYLGVKTIVIDDDIYAHLLGHTQEIGESATSILRRLLGLNAQSTRTSFDVQEIFDFLKRPELFRHMNNSQRFLFILSWAFRKNEKDFAKVVSIEGNRRKYFSRDPGTLLKSGSSVNPRQIPDSPFWVITNNSTAKKCEMLSDVFQMLGYPPEDTNAMLRIAMVSS
jgi:negative modulator of initiation of replication